MKTCVRIEILIEDASEYLRITVRDNGPGFNSEKTTTGYGLTSIRERHPLVYSNNYQFTIDSEKARPTSVILLLPKKHGSEKPLRGEKKW